MDAVENKINEKGPPTYVRGRNQIDAIWVTKDITIDNARFLPFYFGMGDHRGIMIDINYSSMLGQSKKIICNPQGRRLQCNKSKVKRKYIDNLENFCWKHRLYDKLQSMINSHHNSKEKFQKQMDIIDKIMSEGMINAEKKCRKIRAGEVPFCAELSKAGLTIRLWSLVIRHKKVAILIVNLFDARLENVE